MESNGDIVLSNYAPKTLEILEYSRKYPCHSNQIIATKFGLSRERIRQIKGIDNLGNYRSIIAKPCLGCGVKIRSVNKTGYCRKCLSEIRNITLECVNCGKLFLRERSKVLINHFGDIKVPTKYFCSLDCRIKYQHTHYLSRKRKVETLEQNHKGTWCIIDSTKFCQEGICSNCIIFKERNKKCK
jgi:hypothetical protein